MLENKIGKDVWCVSWRQEDDTLIWSLVKADDWGVLPLDFDYNVDSMSDIVMNKEYSNLLHGRAMSLGRWLWLGASTGGEAGGGARGRGRGASLGGRYWAEGERSAPRGPSAVESLLWFQRD